MEASLQHLKEAIAEVEAAMAAMPVAEAPATPEGVASPEEPTA